MITEMIQSFVNLIILRAEKNLCAEAVVAGIVDINLPNLL